MEPETIVVTGADENYFVLACLLMQSLKRFAPRFPFYVLDFGLNGAQRRFLAGRGMLIDMPASVERGSHPFVCKTALGDYLRAVSWLEVVWLDSDTIAVRALDDDLQALVADLKRDSIEVAICQDTVQTVANLFAGGWQMQPFADALRAEGVGLDARYFNTGVFVCRSPELLARWRRVAADMPFHTCFDQNVFNLLLHNSAMTILPSEKWNLHGYLLGDVAPPHADLQQVSLITGTRPLIVHATSQRGQHHLQADGRIGFGDEQLPCRLRIFRNEQLKALQEALFAEFYADAKNEMREAGLFAA